MGMVKVVTPGSYDFGQPPSQLVKLSSDGLRGNDLRNFIKTASHEFVDVLKSWRPDSGEIPIHILAIGATERFGSNRNGDGFRSEPCRDQHSTFTKHARIYRDHANKNPRKSYGYIKASAYNSDMDRIELLAALFATKAAADRHEALVAEREVEKLANDEEIAGSMASLVPHDLCTGCGNKARTRANYCTAPEEGGHCKRGGLKHNIGKLCEDGHLLHADNPINKWFDYSMVGRPADRISFVLGKAAAACIIDNGARPVPREVTAPAALLQTSGYLSESARKQAEWLASSSPKLSPEELLYSGPAVELPPSVKLSHALKALADKQVVLPVPEFLRLIGAAGRTEDLEKLSAVAAAATIDPQSLSADFLADPALYQPHIGAVSPALQRWAEKIALAYSIEPCWAERRVWQLALRRDENPQDATAEYRSLLDKAAGYPADQTSELGEELVGHYRRYRAASSIFQGDVAFS